MGGLEKQIKEKQTKVQQINLYRGDPQADAASANARLLLFAGVGGVLRRGVRGQQPLVDDRHPILEGNTLRLYSRLLAERLTIRRKPGLGTQPEVYYLV